MNSADENRAEPKPAAAPYTDAGSAARCAWEDSDAANTVAQLQAAHEVAKENAASMVRAQLLAHL